MVRSLAIFIVLALFCASAWGQGQVIVARGSASFEPPSCSFSTQTFTMAGSHSIGAVPAGCTQLMVKVWAGAGAGGNRSNGTPNGGAGGGGGGAFASGLVNVTPGNSYSCVVGAGGPAGSGNSNANGDSGEHSSFTGDASSQVLAEGGKGGTGGASGAGGAGGLASNSVGTTKFDGGAGANGSSTVGGKGGGGAGDANAGTAGSGQTGGGGGGSAEGGNGGDGGSNANGGAGSAAGGGGGGASRTGGGAKTGGAGAQGRCEVSYESGGGGEPTIPVLVGQCELEQSAASASISCTLDGGFSTSAGDYAVIYTYWEHATATIAGVSVGSTSGGAVSSRSAGETCSTCFQQPAVVENIAAGQTSCTVNFSASAEWRNFGCYIMRGMVTSSALDQTATVGSGTGLTASSGNMTTTTARQVLFGFAHNGAYDDRTWTPGTGYTRLSLTANDYIYVQMRFVTATDTYTNSATLGGSGTPPWRMHGISVKVLD